jgi:hypothetical protein
MRKFIIHLFDLGSCNSFLFQSSFFELLFLSALALDDFFQDGIANT